MRRLTVWCQRRWSAPVSVQPPRHRRRQTRLSCRRSVLPLPSAAGTEALSAAVENEIDKG